MDKEYREPPILKSMQVIVGESDGTETDGSELTDDKKRKKFLLRLVRQLALSFLFGYTGIPMLWRTSKHYGLFLLTLFAVCLTVTLTTGWWYLFLIDGFLWMIDWVTLCTRIWFYGMGYRRHKRALAKAARAESDASDAERPDPDGRTED